MMKIFNTTMASIILSLSASVNAAPMVYFDFDGDMLADTTTSVLPNTNFSADLYISGIDNSFGGLLSWGVDIQFDQTLVQAINFSVDPQWFLHGVNNNIDNASGVINLFESSFSGTTGTIKLATIDFNSLLVGEALITLGNTEAANPNFVGFASPQPASHNYDEEITFINSAVTISNVPVPSAIWLMMSGLFGLFSISRAKSKR